jgi:hypothetical protein
LREHKVDCTTSRHNEKRGERMFAWIEQALDRLRKIALNILAIVATGIVAYAIWNDVWSGSYLIEPIATPEDFGKKVQDKVGVGALLRDDVGEFVKAAQNQVAIAPIPQDRQEPDITIAGSTLSFRYFADMLRDIVGHQYTRIAGELTTTEEPATTSLGGSMSGSDDRKAEPRVTLTLREADGANGPFFLAEGTYHEVVKRGALEALKIIDPYSPASYLGRGSIEDRREALALISSALSKSSDVPRGELARGNLLLAIAQFADAEKHFQNANSEFAKRHSGRVSGIQRSMALRQRGS